MKVKCLSSEGSRKVVREIADHRSSTHNEFFRGL